jgi:EAL domain-containing protein (putative c-di-GMP-specific phosphodiesterase class I)
LKHLTQSWLDQQCCMIGSISHAVALMRTRDDLDFTPQAAIPAAGSTPPELLATARDAIRHGQPIVHRPADCRAVIASPVMTGSRMHGVVAIAIEQLDNPDCRAIIEQLCCGCTWLGMLVQRETESAKHYLATMLEMAAMFLESRQPQQDDPADPVITRIIDALHDHLGTDASTLLQQIHDTVHHARGIESGSSTARAAAARGDELSDSLARALQEERLVLHYQPKVNLVTGHIACMEALLRLEHPRHGLLPAARFLPAAEQHGMMQDIDDWVLHSACRQLQTWQGAGHENLSVAVNLSAAGFMQPHLVRQLLGVTGEYGIRPDNLEIEVTECTLMDNIDTTAGVIRALRETGIRISVDDFGTGYSSLNYLQRFAVSSIKIDRSFVRQITTDADIATIVRGIIAMAHAAGLGVIAEGVETGAQLAFLRRLHCDQFQGYLFSKPLAADAAGRLLALEATRGSLLDSAERAS